MKKIMVTITIICSGISANAKFIICNAPLRQSSPVIHENRIFWEDNRLCYLTDGRGTYCNEIFFKNIPKANDMWIHNIEDSSFNIKSLNDVWDNYVVYGVSNAGTSPKIIVYSLSQQKQVFESGSPSFQGQIHNNIVVWMTEKGTRDIYGYNINTSTEFPIFVGPKDQEEPVIYGNVVAWIEDVGYPNANIWAKNIQTDELFEICNASGAKAYLKIYKDTIIWRDNRNGLNELYGYDLLTETEFSIAEDVGPSNIYGNQVIYTQYPNGHCQECPTDLYVYDIITGAKSFLIYFDRYYAQSMSIYKEIFVWSESLNGDENIYGENIERLLSTSVEVGQVETGITTGNSGIDFTQQGYKDTVDVWYNFTAPSDGDYIISTLGSNFDTTLGVFDEDYIEIEFNDNYGCKQSKVTLRAEEAVKYYIRIAGYNGQTGNYMLSIINDGPEPLRSDINEDGNVNLVDMSIMAGEWLKP